MHKEGRAASSVAKSLAVIARYRVQEGKTDPTKHPLVKRAKQTAARLAPPVRSRKPLTRALLEKMRASVKLDVYEEVRDFTMMLFGFRAVLRAAELVALKAKDVWLDRLAASDELPTTRPFPPKNRITHHASVESVRDGKAPAPTENLRAQVIAIHIRHDKTNQQSQKHPDLRSGRTVLITGDADLAMSPLLWFRRLMKRREFDPSLALPLFHRKPAPHKPSGELENPLEPSTINHTVQNWVRDRCRLTDWKEYGGHSLRAGGATAAMRGGAKISDLKSHGRWRSDAVYVYIHDEVHAALAVNQAVGGLALVAGT